MVSIIEITKIQQRSFIEFDSLQTFTPIEPISEG